MGSLLILSSAVAIIAYVCAWLILLRSALKRDSGSVERVLSIIAVGLLAHAVSVYYSMHLAEGFSFGFYKVASLIFGTINLIVLLSSLRNPLHNIFILLLPFAVLAIIVAVFFAPTSNAISLNSGLFLHVILSILAYSIFTIASFHALLLAWQNRKLKLKQPASVRGLLPPLQTMETLLFEFIWVGELLLTLALLSGVVFLEDVFAQHLSHKIAFSVLAWVIYATVLFGRHRLAWGGMTAVKWTLGGFVALATAYYGSKFVYELLLTA